MKLLIFFFQTGTQFGLMVPEFIFLFLLLDTWDFSAGGPDVAVLKAMLYPELWPGGRGCCSELRIQMSGV